MIILACKDTIELTTSLLSLKESLAHSLKSVKKRASLMPVLDVLFQEPVLSISDMARRTGMWYNTVKAVIKELEDRGIVLEITDQQRDRAYICVPVFQLIFERNKSVGGVEMEAVRTVQQEGRG